MALAVAATAALWDTRWRVVPADEGAWRGLSDPPSLLRIAASAAAGLISAVLLARAPRRARRPVLALGLVLLPALPVLTGRLLPLLALQGPVLVLLVAAVAAVVATRLATEAPRPAAGLSPALLFLAGFVFFAFLSTRLPGPAGPQGDEPQYLVLAHSLLTDGDVDLADEFARRDYAAFFAGTLEPHTSPFSPAGRAYSIHTPGLAALVLPAYAAGGYPAVRLWLCALAALAAVLVFRAVHAWLGDALPAAVAWAVLVFTPPLPFYAMRLYPETPAVLAAAVFLWTSLGPGGGRAVALAAAAAAALPWMHPKLLLLSVLGLGITLARPARRTARVAAVAALAVSVALLLAHFHAQFGRPSLHGGFPIVRLSPSLLPRGVAAVLFDRQFGLLAVSPVFALALPGALALWRRHDWRALVPLSIGGLFLALAGAFEYWWGGACPPARYVLPGVPAFAALLAPAVRARPALFAALCGIGLGIVGLAAEAPRVVHNRPDGESLLLRFLAPAFDLDGLFPSYFEAGAAPLLLTAALVCAGFAAWRFGLAGAVAGATLLVLLSAAVRDRPPIDRRAATLDLLWDWQPDALAGPDGAPRLASLALPLELPRAPWVLEAGEQRNSRRMDVPAGRYLFHATIEPAGPGARVHVELGSGPLVFVAEELHGSRASLAAPVLLPTGARALGVSAAGREGKAELVGARLVPEALLPRAERGRFAWPEFAEPARYRVPAGRLHVTVVDRSFPEGDGFRLAGARAEMVVDGPPEAVAVVHVVRPRPGPSDRIEWGSRAVQLGPLGEVVLELPLREGRRLGPDAVVPFRVHADGAWLRVREASR